MPPHSMLIWNNIDCIMPALIRKMPATIHKRRYVAPSANGCSTVVWIDDRVDVDMASSRSDAHSAVLDDRVD